MVPPRPFSAPLTDAALHGGARVSACQGLALVAEREFLGALAKQTPPAYGLYTRPSPAEAAAFDLAAEATCREAHRLGLRAEELVVAIKQAWSHLSTERKTQLGDRDGDVLREVVSSSIEYFFEPREAEGRRAQQ